VFIRQQASGHILRAAQEGDADPDLDPQDMFDILLGAMAAQTVIRINAR